MDQGCRWVIKYFSCLLDNAVLNGPIWITQSSQHTCGPYGVMVAIMREPAIKRGVTNTCYVILMCAKLLIKRSATMSLAAFLIATHLVFVNLILSCHSTWADTQGACTRSVISAVRAEWSIPPTVGWTWAVAAWTVCMSAVLEVIG